MESELIALLPKLAEYGSTGIVMGGLYLIARMYLPHAAALSKALGDLPPALAALVERVKEVEEGLADVRRELAVIRDRLPRVPTALLRDMLERGAGTD